MSCHPRYAPRPCGVAAAKAMAKNTAICGGASARSASSTQFGRTKADAVALFSTRCAGFSFAEESRRREDAERHPPPTRPPQPECTFERFHKAKVTLASTVDQVRRKIGTR